MYTGKLTENLANEDQIIKIDFKKKKAYAELVFLTFRDGDYYGAYAPSVNLSGYGNTEQEAIDMITKIAVKDYLDSLLVMSESQAIHELRELGWKRNPFLSKELRNRQIIDETLIKSNLNLPEETVIRKLMVAA